MSNTPSELVQHLELGAGAGVNSTRARRPENDARAGAGRGVEIGARARNADHRGPEGTGQRGVQAGPAPKSR